MAEMPKLAETLTSYAAQGYKLASIYNPPSVKRHNGMIAGAGQWQTDCHLIFEASPVRYSMQFVDAPFGVTVKCCDTQVRHDVYLDAIQQFQAKGWGLAGLIDLPDYKGQSGTTFSTVKLVFQAPVGTATP